MKLTVKRVSLLIVFFLGLLCITNCQYDYNRHYNDLYSNCNIPLQLHGSWYSREKGNDVSTKIDSSSFTINNAEIKRCASLVNYNNDNFTLHLKNERTGCHQCVRILVRTLNVLEKLDGPCVTLEAGATPSLHSVCQNTDFSKELITMFSKNYQGKNCKSSIEGVYEFGYRLTHLSSGECYNHESRILACQKPGNQFSVVNSQFDMIYKSCEGSDNKEDRIIQYKCLGDWYVGKNHYFALVNTRESRQAEAFRCFLTNRDDSTHIGASITPECSVLHSPQDAPERITLRPVKAETIIPSCQLPDSMRGDWINTANLDATVKINSTHMTERWKPDSATVKEEIYVCHEQRGTRYVMARLGINGCQKDFVCFDFVRPHHNIIRYRKGQAMSSSRFATVCAWTNFDNSEEWMYDLLIAAKPSAFRCPVAGKFRFIQKGEIPFETRIRGGVTQSPRDNINCKEKISDLSVCDADQKNMEIDAEYCISVDQRGTQIDYQSDPDHRLKCIGFWKENLKSYLITYDELDAYSRYRCWVYQRSDLNRVLMSMSVGAFCHIKQEVTSWNSSEGAQVALDMIEYEREHDECPMFFDDGSNPYLNQRESAIILDARRSSSSRVEMSFIIAIFAAVFALK